MPSSPLDLGHRTVDLETGRLDDGTVLTSIELRLLVHLIERSGRPCLAQELLRDVWGYRATRTNTVKTTVNRLRRKLGDAGVVRSARGRGYWFEGPTPPPERSAPVCPGRDDVLVAVLRALEDAPVVTLVGPTGVGKTHVASALAAAWRAPFVRLAELHDVAGLAGAAAQALGCSPAELRTALERTRLLVLDNAEHLADLGAKVQRWPTRLLVTSQVPLGVPGEHQIRLGPPADDHAVDLLVDRAARAGVELDPEDPAVARLVAGTEGLPLALELAAARLLATGAGLLADDPSLLQDSWVDAGRHSGLDAAAAWSWSLLTPQAQADLARLSWFEHAFWARDVPGLLGEDGHPRVATLAKRSCLRAVAPGRLALFAPIRRYARQHAQAQLQAHERWLDDQLVRAQAQKYGPDSDDALQRILSLENDLFAALDRTPSDAVIDALTVVCANTARHALALDLAKRFPRPTTRIGPPTRSATWAASTRRAAGSRGWRRGRPTGCARSCPATPGTTTRRWRRRARRWTPPITTPPARWCW